MRRACVTCQPAPSRSISPPGIPAPAPLILIGISIIGIPPPAAPAACVNATGLGGTPNPDIAEEAIEMGIDPCHVGGTDIDPTN